MIEIFIFLGLGIAMLIKSSSKLIDSLTKISDSFGISRFYLGFLFLALLTSLPELSIAFFSGIEKLTSLSFGNLVGASIANLYLVLPLASLAYPLKIKRAFLKKYFFILAIIFFLALYGMIYGFDSNFGFLGIITFLLLAEQAGERIEDGTKKRDGRKIKKLAFLSLLYSILLVESALLIVECVKIIVNATGISSLWLGACLLGIATTLPEFTVELEALRMGRHRIAFGNAVGSAFVNLTFILGILAILSPFRISGSAFSILLCFFAFYLLFLALLFWKEKIDRMESLILILIYFLFVIIFL